MYRTGRPLRRTLRVAYPAGRGRMVLRTELDWDRDVEPVEVGADGTVSTFVVEVDRPFLYYKPCLVEGGTLRWCQGANRLLLNINLGALPHDLFMEQVRRFGKDVLVEVVYTEVSIV